MKRWLVLGCLVVGGCASPAAPTLPSPTADIAYDINIFNQQTYQGDVAAYPNGVRMGPIRAGLTFPESFVYWGIAAPPPGAVINAGVVIAPVSVAQEDTFLGTEWPSLYRDEATTRFIWVGHFVYTQRGQ